LKLQLTPSERLAVDTHGTDQPAAYDSYLRGLGLLAERRRIDVDANLGAQAEFRKAIRIDPDYALAVAGLAWAKWLHIATINVFESTDEAFALAERSITLNDNALAHRTLSKKHFSLQLLGSTTRKIDLAVAELETARRLQPSDPDVLADLATALSFAGQPPKALTLTRKAMELNPSHPKWYFGASGIALLLTENPGRAVDDLRRWSEVDPSWHVPYVFLVAALANSGEVAAAKTALARFNKLVRARVTLPFVRTTWPMAPEQEEVFHRGLRLAGMKETPG
jgi:adenylate cyclase